MTCNHCHQWHLNIVSPLSCEMQIPAAPIFMKVFHNWRRQWKIKELSVAQLCHPSAFVTLYLLLRDSKSCLYVAHGEIHNSLQIFPLWSLCIFFSPVYKSVLPLLGCDIMSGLSGLCLRGHHPGPLWAVPDILDAIPSTTGRVERGFGSACPLQHGPAVVAPGTVARWHSLKPSHPSPKALLAPHQPGSDHSKSPALQELPGWEPGACFTWLQSPSVQKHLEALCPLQPSHHLLVSLTPNTDVELWLLVCVLSHPLAWCIVFPSIHQPWVDPSICRVRIHKSLRAGSVLLRLKGK